MIGATVCGNVGQAPEYKVLAGGDGVLNFSIASNEKRGDKEQVTWVRCSMFGKRASALANALSQGSSVAVTGTLSMREFEGKNGKGQSLEMRVNDLQFMGAKRDGSSGGGGQSKPSSGGGYGSQDEMPF